MWLLLALLAVASAGTPLADSGNGSHASWRLRDTVDVDTWRHRWLRPRPFTPPDAEFGLMDANARQDAFLHCINEQVVEFTAHVAKYQSPELAQVARTARAALDHRGFTVTLAVFWGRYRYVSILWDYIERNLVANGGIVDKVVLVMSSSHQDEEGKEAAAK
ncbi:MAG: hypothetical protein P4L40_14750, partial [Terracidiphilus sp.]|nr:hypothetical protein [Terracidiphilus sp.]